MLYEVITGLAAHGQFQRMVNREGAPVGEGGCCRLAALLAGLLDVVLEHLLRHGARHQLLADDEGRVITSYSIHYTKLYE